jgi:hypothetical protein
MELRYNLASTVGEAIYQSILSFVKESRRRDGEIQKNIMIEQPEGDHAGCNVRTKSGIKYE